MTGKITEEKFQCSRCRGYFPISEKPRGSRCKDCHRITMRDRYRKNKEAINRRRKIKENADCLWDWAGTSYGIYF